MLIKPRPDVRSSEITPKKLYLNRRAFITAAAAAGVGTFVASSGVAEAAKPAPHGRKLAGIGKSPLSVTNEKVNTWDQVTTYNNYYEFGTDKESPSLTAHTLRTEPWSVMIEGEVAKPASWRLEDLLKGQALEERIYRMRCVEGWSMVIPWVGFPLADLIKKMEPTSKARFVEFTTLNDAGQMPGVRQPALNWPYIEGLRMDEAMHPLTILAVGLYDEVLPKQNGAPLRLVVPWKYGFKNAKSIVRIRFTERQPLNSWQEQNREEYGFYSNVNPTVDHPRWSQATERRIGEFFRRKTLMFNGYDQVASLYAGMDLRRNY